MQGVDFQKVFSESPARAWNILYAMLIENTDKKGREKLDSDIFRKPAGVDRSGGDAFDQSLMAGAAAYAKTLPPIPSAIDS